MSYALEDSITVAATPDEVYAIVSDVTRTGEWSVQCHRCEWNSDARGVGAEFTGFNRTPEREWQTVSTVVADAPGREFAWEVGPGRVQWGFTIAPAAGGAHLTEYTRFGRTAEDVFAQRFPDDAAAQIETRRTVATAGIPVTLARIKEIAERG